MRKQSNTTEYKVFGVVPLTVEYTIYPAEPDVGLLVPYTEIDRVYYCDPHHKTEHDIDWGYYGLENDIYDLIQVSP